MNFNNRRTILRTIAVAAGVPGLGLVKGMEDLSPFYAVTGLILVGIGALCGVLSVMKPSSGRKWVYKRLADYRKMKVIGGETAIDGDPEGEQIFGWPQPDLWPNTASFFGSFRIFAGATICYVGPCAFGTDDQRIEWFLFDVRRVTGSGWRCREHRFSVVMAILPDNTLPLANISTSQNELPGFAFEGLHEVTLGTRDNFRQYRVWANDTASARGFMRPEVMKPLLGRGVELLQTNGSFVMLARPKLSSANDLKLDREALEMFISAILNETVPPTPPLP